MKSLLIIVFLFVSFILKAQSRWHYYLSNVSGERSINAFESVEDLKNCIHRFYILYKDNTNTADSIYFLRQKKWVGAKVVEQVEFIDNDPKIDYYCHKLNYVIKEGDKNGFVSISLLEDKMVRISSWLESAEHMVLDTSFVSTSGVIEGQLIEAVIN